MLNDDCPSLLAPNRAEMWKRRIYLIQNPFFFFSLEYAGHLRGVSSSPLVGLLAGYSLSFS